MKKTRKIHLWIGLITSIFLFVEAGTGLLLTERWLMGQSSHANSHNQHTEDNGHSEKLSMMDAVLKASETGAFKMEDVSVVMNHGMYLAVLNDADRTRITIAPNGTIVGKEVNKFANIVRGLHVGKLGDFNLRWMVDIAAISIMVLTGTGIYLSYKILRSQNKRKKTKKLHIA